MVGPSPAPPTARASPLATYRLQFSRDFTFRDAERLVPYLAALGVSHVYASPYLAARAGSAHGYDITDHNAFNPEIGEEPAFEAFAAALARHGMGQILDFVPNHMGIGRADNAWWLDVLEWGEASPYAEFFDIDWRPVKAELRGKVLVPFLGAHYGHVLEQGELRLAFERADGSFSVWYHEHRFPIEPRHYARILDRRWAALRAAGGPGEGLARALDHLVGQFRALRAAGEPARRRAAVRERAAALKAELAERAAGDPEFLAFVEDNVQLFNGTVGVRRSFMPLHRLLEAQAYRLAYWRVAADEINYRRFFDINELIGLRMERADLFERAHRLVFRLIAQGRLDGLRIDHIDGLYDPQAYCAQVQAQVAAISERAADPAPGPLYLLVEKILAPHERVRQDWPVAGTTGYEFISLVNGLFVDPAGERGLDRAYRRFIGRDVRFEDVLYECKHYVMDNVLAGELQVLASELARLSEGNWRTRDFTLNGLRAALKEVVACFPVYRTYVTGQSVTAEDRRDIDWAVAQARKRTPTVESSIYDFVHAALTTDLVRAPRSGYSRRRAVRFAMRFQQFTGPVMAKSMEDTSFYRYHRLVSLNEVGGEPRRFGISVAAFHHLNLERARHWPHGMLTTATHDTKRGEDVRARLNVLSEMADEWARRVRQWARLNRRNRKEVDGVPAPTANDEYLLYQTLLGAWPLTLDADPEPGGDRLAAFCERVQAYMTKALREAKVNSSWANPNPAYEEAVTAFVARILERARPNPFLADFLPFEARVARLGAVNGLAQTVLKLTVPGVPDTYQGTELWDLALVDPDNRRPVDYACRIDRLEALQRGLRGCERGKLLARLVETWADGTVKLFLIWRLLNLRRRQAELFQDGDYIPLGAQGACADHVCAFARRRGQDCCVVVVPRLVARLSGAGETSRLGAFAWADTTVEVPAEVAGPRLRDLFSGAEVAPSVAGEPARLEVAGLLRELPVAVLVPA